MSLAGRMVDLGGEMRRLLSLVPPVILILSLTLSSLTSDRALYGRSVSFLGCSLNTIDRQAMMGQVLAAGAGDQVVSLHPHAADSLLEHAGFQGDDVSFLQHVVAFGDDVRGIGVPEPETMTHVAVVKFGQAVLGEHGADAPVDFAAGGAGLEE